MSRDFMVARFSTLTRLVTLASVAALFVITASAQQTIDATATGTGTQLGHPTNIRLIINSFSTPEDRETFKQAFLTGQNNGLVEALRRARSVGRITLPGTVGFDVSYISQVPTPTGRKITFVTNRRIAIGEAANNTRSRSFNLTGGEITIDDSNSSNSSGVLYPAAQLIINVDGDLQVELRQNPWRLNNIIVRGTVASQ